MPLLVAYVATQFLFAVVETGVEYASVEVFGDEQAKAEFSGGKSFGIALLTNLATGGIGGKAKAAKNVVSFGRRAAGYVLRQGAETVLESSIESVAYGSDFGENLLYNGAVNVAGEGLARGGGHFVKRFRRGGSDAAADALGEVAEDSVGVSRRQSTDALVTGGRHQPTARV